MTEWLEISIATPWGTVRGEFHPDKLVKQLRNDVVHRKFKTADHAEKFTLAREDETLLTSVPLGVSGVEDGDVLKLRRNTEVEE
jgi:hypothetical protein